ncbi:MAG: LPS assembly protein LptD [Akkermansiaceae bacterium]|nr:LPS assembly protein LptD [Akkermansiaceae bacterium]
MLNLRAWLVAPLLVLPLRGQDADALPDPAEVPEVDMITPVPPPEIPFGEPLADEEAMMPKELKLDNFGGGRIEFDQETGVIFHGPGVKITGDNGMEVFADRARVDFKAESVTLTGNVSVYQGNILQRGDEAVYFYERRFLDTRGLRASVDPVLLEAGKFTVEESGGKRSYVGYDAAVTTADMEHPDYWVRAKKTRVYPGDRIVFHDPKLYIGGTPVFWLPYLSQPLDAELGYHFIPGARSTWGPFLLNTYGIMLGGERDPVTGENEDAWLLSKWHFDIRANRGIGAGVDLRDTRQDNPEAISGLSLYYLNDLDPGASRNGVPRGFVNEDRYRVELKHRIRPDFPDDADWRIDANLSWLSDRYFLEDFDPSTYRIDPAPDNTLGIYRRDDRSLLSLFTRLRINDFYRSDTRLPEIAFDQARAPLFGLPVLHEGSTSFGILGEEAPDPTRRLVVDPLMTMTAEDPEARRLIRQLGGYERRLAQNLVALPLNDPKRESIRSQLLDPGYSRFHTYQEVSLPITAGFLTVAPQAGFGYSNYSSVDGPETGFDRTHVHAGVESSLKFSRDYASVSAPDWGVNGLLHVIQPYGMWSWVSTDDFDPWDPSIDRLTPTTRPRPLDPARFTAVDEMQSWNVLRFGARNRLITKRDDRSFEWLFLDTYMEAFIEDPEGSRDFSNLYNDAYWQPLPWLGVEVSTQFPVYSSGSGFSEYATRLHFMPTDSFEFSFGHRWLDGHPILIDSNRFDLETYTRVSENWGVGTRHIMELDDGTLELQQYTLHREAGSWLLGMGLSSRDNRLEKEYGMVFSVTLKDFPSVSLPFELSGE